MEYSQSGNGLHIVCEGHFPKNFRHNKKGQNIEIYVKDRFIAFTGKPYKIANEPVNRQPQLNQLIKFYKIDVKNKADNKTTLEQSAASKIGLADEDQKLIEKLRKSAEFQSLYDGLPGTQYSSPSESDIRLMQLIWLQSRNEQQTIRIFRSSKLGQREKTALRSDYLERTLDTVLQNTREWETKKPKTERLQLGNERLQLGNERSTFGLQPSKFDMQRVALGSQLTPFGVQQDSIR